MRLSLAIVFFSLSTFSYGQQDTLLLVSNAMMYFDNASSEIRPDQIAMVDSLLRIINKTDNARVSIQAHTDQVGNPEYNETLSKERANSIATYLVNQGIQEDIIESTHFGEEQLMTSNQNPDSLQQNRRALVSIYTAKPAMLLTGRVIDKKTDSPLIASVFMHSKSWSKEVITDSLGRFNLVVPKDQVIGINTTAPKYLASKEMAKATVQLIQNPKIIKLTPVEGQWMTGQILNDSGAYITNAKIQMRSKLWSDTTHTDSSGDFKLFVPKAGIISLDIVAKDYLIEMKNLEVTPQLMQEPLSIKLARISDGKKFKLQRIFFVAGQDFLLQKSFNVLPQLYTFMETNQNTCIRIDGHINWPNRPKTKVNSTYHDLSIARSRRIYKFLTYKGIRKDRIVYKGYGNWHMVHPQAESLEDMAENRRVEIVIVDCDKVSSLKNDNLSTNSDFFNFRPQSYD